MESARHLRSRPISILPSKTVPPRPITMRIASARVELVGPSPKGRQNLRGPRKCIFHENSNAPAVRSDGQGPLRSLCRSGSLQGLEATQISRNTSDLCIQYGRAPFFGKVPSVQFLIQRYRGKCQLSRARSLPPLNFKRSKRARFSSVSEIHNCPCDFRDFCIRQGGNSHTFTSQ